MEDKNQEMNSPEMKDAGMDASAGNDAGAPKGKVTKRGLTSRGILLIGIGGLLVVLLIAGGIAWYTRISVVNQMSVDAAKFDFKANYTDEDFIIQAKDYVDLYEDGKAAPGTAGVIPVLIQAGDSDVDVNYQMSLVQAGTDDAFMRRIRFFYIPADKVDDAMASGTYDPQYEQEFTTNNAIKGRLKGGDDPTHGEHYEYIYWEWVYDLNPYRLYDIYGTDGTDATRTWLIASDSSAAYTDRFNAIKDDTKYGSVQFDTTDTLIGLGKCDDYFLSTESNAEYTSEMKRVTKTDPQTGQVTEEDVKVKAYQKAMNYKIDITGAQATPTYKFNPVSDPQHGQSSASGTYGSGYVDLAQVISSHNSMYPADYWQ